MGNRLLLGLVDFILVLGRVILGFWRGFCLDGGVDVEGEFSRGFLGL